MNIKDKTFKIFNDKYGSDLNNFKNIEHFHQQLENEKSKVEKSLSLVSSEAPSVVQEAINEVNDIVKKMDNLKTCCETFCNDAEKRLDDENNPKDLQIQINKILYLEKASSYLLFIKFIEDLSSELEVSLISGNDEAYISSYIILKDTFLSLKTSSCTNLKNFVQETLEFWFEAIKNIFSKEYTDILKTLKWPFEDVNSISVSNSEVLSRFKKLTEHVFHLQLPYATSTNIGVMSSFKPVCLPVRWLVIPLKKRFFYHFTGTKQTNRHDKPEWFFTKVLFWIKNHADWIEKNVQPIANLAGFKKINVKVEFMRALVKLAVDKLHSELNVVQYDDSLFAHIIDEALGFERELREIYFYPSSEPATVLIITQGHIFLKWITMEKKYALEKMDSILSSETAWSLLPGLETDDLKVTESAEAFMTLLNTITDRYNHLTQPGHRLQFLDLQLELIDDWRVRLLQLLHEDYEEPLSSLIPPILNSISYVTRILQDWGTNPAFLKLFVFKKQFKDAESTMNEEDLSEKLEKFEEVATVFDDAIGLLQRLENKLEREICDSVLTNVKSKSKPYRDAKWFSMHFETGAAFKSITPSGCPMFKEIANQLNLLHKVLASPIFKKSLRNIAFDLDEYLLTEIILCNKFCIDGAKQLEYDIKRNLLSLFGLYSNEPESYFPFTLEACNLLNLLTGSALLFIEALETEPDENIIDILLDGNIYKLEKDMVLKILKCRIDLTTL